MSPLDPVLQENCLLHPDAFREGCAYMWLNVRERFSWSLPRLKLLTLRTLRSEHVKLLCTVLCTQANLYHTVLLYTITTLLYSPSLIREYDTVLQ